MSSHPIDEQVEEAPLPSEPERIPWGKVAVVAVVTLAVFGLGVAWSAWTLKSGAQRWIPGPVDAPPQVGQVEIGIVDQQPFEHERRALEQRARQEARLRSYGWVDKEKRLIHLPIERAMELTVEGRR